MPHNMMTGELSWHVENVGSNGSVGNWHNTDNQTCSFVSISLKSVEDQNALSHIRSKKSVGTIQNTKFRTE